MCQFCTKHGEGKKWYLQAKNYADELWHLEGRAKFTDEFFRDFENGMAPLSKIDKLPPDSIIGKLVRRMTENRMRKDHYGQIVPIEDVEQILDISDSITRLACVCRMATRGRECRYCFGLTSPAKKVAGLYPDYANSFETLTKSAALELIRSFEQDGMTHSVWTFKTPYIAGLCNCDGDCMAYRALTYGNIKLMFKGEYVASIDLDLCTGCRSCTHQCQFDAISYSASLKRCFVDVRKCYGCGICRATCGHDAISLISRKDVPAVKNNW